MIWIWLNSAKMFFQNCISYSELQGTWEIDTGSGAGYKFVEDKFMWLKSIEDVSDNYWYGDVEYYNGAEEMEIVWQKL